MSTGQQQEEGGLKVNYQDISHILQTFNLDIFVLKVTSHTTTIFCKILTNGPGGPV
jgi:hypothetical protein